MKSNKLLSLAAKITGAHAALAKQNADPALSAAVMNGHTYDALKASGGLRSDPVPAPVAMTVTSVEVTPKPLGAAAVNAVKPKLKAKRSVMPYVPVTPQVPALAGMTPLGLPAKKKLVPVTLPTEAAIAAVDVSKLPSIATVGGLPDKPVEPHPLDIPESLKMTKAQRAASAAADKAKTGPKPGRESKPAAKPAAKLPVPPRPVITLAPAPKASAKPAPAPTQPATAKPKGKPLAKRETGYDWEHAEKLAAAGNIPPLPTWKSYDVHTKQFYDMAVAGDVAGIKAKTDKHVDQGGARANMFRYVGLLNKALKAAK